MSADHANDLLASDTEAEAPDSTERRSAKSGKRRRRLGPARAEAKARTRRALLDAAEMLFAQEGFDQPGLDVICSVAGRTRGAYNVHFGSREELVAAVVLRALERFEAESTAEEAWDRLLLPAVSRAAPPASDIGEHRRLSMPLVLHAAARIPEVKNAALETFERVRRYLGEMAAQAQGAGNLRFNAAPSVVASTLLATRVGLELLEATGAQSPELDRGELRDLLATLLRPDAGARQARGY